MSGGAVEPRFSIGSATSQESPAALWFHQWTLQDGSPWLRLYRDGRDYLLRFPGLADFRVSHDGREVSAHPLPGTEAVAIEHLYRNQVLPLALSRQGRLVLHASAIEAQGRALAFAGASGRGKSTLAACFARSGGRFMTDDGLQLEWRGPSLMALPSHPSIRLWADSEAALIAAGQPAAPMPGYTAKMRFLAGGALAHLAEARPLHRIYMLGDGQASQPEIRPAHPAAAVRELISHSFLLDIEQQELLARHFDDVARIANLGIVYHLDHPRRFDALPDVMEAVLRHAAASP